MNIRLFLIVLVLFLGIIGYLYYLGKKNTQNSRDFNVAGRGMNSFTMALSYGATAVSTSVIVGFGGIAGVYGMGMLWLTFLNISLGCLISFIFFGKRVRKIGAKIDVHTFPELLGRRYDSRFIQVMGGIVIFTFMPLYAAVVLIGASRFIENTFNVNFTFSLIVFSVVISIFVINGGLKGIMYAEVFQGSIIFIGMLILISLTYRMLGGIIPAHQALTSLVSEIPKDLLKVGHQGWTAIPASGSSMWFTLITTLILGVGIGQLALPQLAVRFMTIKSNKEINRGIMVLGIFFLVITGGVFTVGSLSNVYFFKKAGELSITAAGGNTDNIIPIFINSAMPQWFVYIFVFSLLAAAMSNTSSQLHTLGTALSRDIAGAGFKIFKNNGSGDTKKQLFITKIGITIGIVLSMVVGYFLPPSIIAKGTTLFFGVCAAVFLPMYALGLFWKRTSKAGAVSGMVTGFITSLFWMFFVHKSTASMLKLVVLLTGKESILPFPWNTIDPIIISFTLSFIVTVLVSLFTKPVKKEILSIFFN